MLPKLLGPPDQVKLRSSSKLKDLDLGYTPPPPDFVKLRVLSHVLSWLTLGLVYEMSRDDSEIRSIMGLNEYTRVVRNCIFGFSFLRFQVQIQASSNKF